MSGNVPWFSSSGKRTARPSLLRRSSSTISPRKLLIAGPEVVSYSYDLKASPLLKPKISTSNPCQLTRNPNLSFHYKRSSVRVWPSRDPIGERGGINLYGMIGNCLIDRIDHLGLSDWIPTGDPPDEDADGLHIEDSPIRHFRWIINCSCSSFVYFCCDDPYRKFSEVFSYNASVVLVETDYKRKPSSYTEEWPYEPGSATDVDSFDLPDRDHVDRKLALLSLLMGGADRGIESQINDFLDKNETCHKERETKIECNCAHIETWSTLDFRVGTRFKMISPDGLKPNNQTNDPNKDKDPSNFR